MLKNITLFGKDIPYKQHFCALNGNETTIIDEPYISVYVRLTNNCPANCKFCEFHGKDSNDFDFYKFYFVLNEITKRIKINKLNFTGGEPTLKHEVIKKCLPIINDLNPETFVTVNTNGYKLIELYDHLEYIDSISLSRHHYNDDNNAKLFGMEKSPFSLVDIKNFPRKDKLNLSCNLIKGGINSAEECKKYINFFSSLGIYSYGFVSLMQINEFCKNNLIDFESLNFKNDSDILNNKQWKRNGGICKCNNYLMSTDNGQLAKIYAKYFVKNTECEGILVYDNGILKLGFNGPIIYKA